MWIIIVLLFVIISILSINKYTYENFIPLLTANPVKMIPTSCIDDSVRNVRLNSTGNIMYASVNPPLEAKCNQVNCPDYVNKYTTLGDNNVCWKC